MRRPAPRGDRHGRGSPRARAIGIAAGGDQRSVREACGGDRSPRAGIRPSARGRRPVHRGGRRRPACGASRSGFDHSVACRCQLVRSTGYRTSANGGYPHSRRSGQRYLPAVHHMGEGFTLGDDDRTAPCGGRTRRRTPPRRVYFPSHANDSWPARMGIDLNPGGTRHRGWAKCPASRHEACRVRSDAARPWGVTTASRCNRCRTGRSRRNGIRVCGFRCSSWTSEAPFVRPTPCQPSD